MKSNRACVVTQPSRKRQKKTDSRVAELEKKIEDLQAMAAFAPRPIATTTPGASNTTFGIGLHSMQAAYEQNNNGGYSRGENSYQVQPQTSASDWGSYAKTPDAEGKSKGAPMVVAAGRQKRKFAESPEDTTSGSSVPYKGPSAKTLYDQVHSVWADNAEPKPSQTHIYSDVIDRGYLTAEDAEQIFHCYVNDMVPHFPAVVFPQGTSASSVRKEKPILFLAILAAGAGPVMPKIQQALTKEVMAVYADRVIVKGEKSLEIIQALQINTIWYYPPEHFEELKFYQLIHIAAIMAIDIGMGKSSKASGAKSAGLFRDTPWRKQPYPDSDSIEARRAWLACYFLCCSTSMGLRRPNIIRWTSYMKECLDVLESSPDAAKSDIVLCAWVRSQHIAEEIGYEFSMDDSSAKVSISDDKVNYAMKKFEQDLTNWRAEVPVSARSGKQLFRLSKSIQLTVIDSLEMTGHVVDLYMHEIAMHVDHNVEEFKPPYSEETVQGLINPPKSEVLTTTHVRALSLCLVAIDGVFDVFLKHSVEVLRCLPVANFVRVAYAVVVLIKMALAASHTESGIGKIFVQSELKVEQRLDGLIHLFSAAAAGEKSRPSSKFLMVLVMLKTWFNRRKQNFKQAEHSPKVSNLDTKPCFEQHGDGQPGNVQRTNGQHQSNQALRLPPSSNTPLQVLSDVATGNSREQQAQAENQYASSSSNDWQQSSMQNQFQPYSMDAMPQQNFAGAGNVDNYGMTNLDYTMGDGFESAMGFTLAGLDAYLGDEFFAGVVNGGYNYEG